MNKRLFNFAKLILTSASLLVCMVFATSHFYADELSPQEIEMRKLVLQMLKNDLMQSCEGISEQSCVSLSESSCKRMMTDLLSKCLEPSLTKQEQDSSTQCGETVLAEYGLTEEVAGRCGIEVSS